MLIATPTTRPAPSPPTRIALRDKAMAPAVPLDSYESAATAFDGPIKVLTVASVATASLTGIMLGAVSGMRAAGAGLVAVIARAGVGGVLLGGAVALGLNAAKRYYERP